MSSIAVKEVLRKYWAETAGADHDDVERARITLRTGVQPECVLVGALKRFIKTVASVATEDIASEVRGFGRS
jgi:hypothetical protein